VVERIWDEETSIPCEVVHGGTLVTTGTDHRIGRRRGGGQTGIEIGNGITIEGVIVEIAEIVVEIGAEALGMIVRVMIRTVVDMIGIVGEIRGDKRR